MRPESNVSIQEEDELIQFAYVPRNVSKCYAVCYRGRPQDLPHVFLKYVEGYSEGIRHNGYHRRIFLVDGNARLECEHGDWIMIHHDILPNNRPYLGVHSDTKFRENFRHVRDLSYL